MGRTIAIGIQDYSTLIEKNCFYIDKTAFIREWWENEDAGRSDLFEKQNIWQEKAYRSLQGTYPVISLPCISCLIIYTVIMEKR